MDNTELTTTELEFIKLKREKDELELKERQLKLKAKREEDIEKKKKEIESFKTEMQTQNTKAESFLVEFNAFSNNYILVKKEQTKTFECYDYDNPIKKENGETDFVKEIYFTEDVQYIECIIQRKELSNNSWQNIEVYFERGGYYSGKKGWLLKYGYKSYKTVNSIHKNIQSKINELKREQETKTNKANAKVSVLETLTQKHPDALKIEWEEKYHNSYSYNRRNSGYHTTHYYVKFANGFVLDYEYTEIGKIYEPEFNGLHNFDTNTLIDLLKNLPKKPEETKE